MRLKFISNACQVIESQGKKLLCDPWLSEGAFEGSWYHWPPIRTTWKDVSDYDYLYISHIDPDHFDPKTLEHFDKEKPVLILDFEFNYLGGRLGELGFKNIIRCVPNTVYDYPPFRFTLFAPFQKTRLETESVIGNVIDSAILVEADGHRVLNTVDNLPSIDSAQWLQSKFGPFDLVQLNYNSAGPYPDCFTQYSIPERKFKADEFLRKQLRHVFDLCMVFEGAAIMPFAGDYVLVGKEQEKNYFNATCSPEYAKHWVEAEFRSYLMRPNPMIIMDEGDVLDFDSWVSLREFPTVKDKEVGRFTYGWKKRDVPYPHDFEESPDPEELVQKLYAARENVEKKAQHFKFEDPTVVVIKVYEGVYFIFDFQWMKVELHTSLADLLEVNPETPHIIFSMDPRLLNRIIHRKAQWNNAEIGAHIEMVRRPDVYKQDIHLLMNFFHL